MVLGKTLLVNIIGLYHPLYGVTKSKYKLLCFITNIFCEEKKALAVNWDRCCHLAHSLQLILFHFYHTIKKSLSGEILIQNTSYSDSDSTYIGSLGFLSIKWNNLAWCGPTQGAKVSTITRNILALLPINPFIFK